MEWIRRGLKMVIWKFDQKNGGKGDKYVDIHLVDELTEYVSQELDKAREEVLIELQEEFSEFGVPDDVRYSTPLFYINEVIERKLSKLKDNK